MEKSSPFIAIDNGSGCGHGKRKKTMKWVLKWFYTALLASAIFSTILRLAYYGKGRQQGVKIPLNSREILKQCALLEETPRPPFGFHSRNQSDRFVPGTTSVLIQNATIWTGNRHETIRGDILLSGGIIKAVGVIDQFVLNRYKDLVVHEVEGAWVSPGIVDLHSHLGVYSAPALSGAADGNSRKGPILPWLRSLDGLNTHDEAYRLSIAGGITTALVLPGSANAIGGQAFTIKLRPTAERSSTSMLLEPPFNLALNQTIGEIPLRWRQMKHACGENPSRVYSGTRMDTIWAFRQGYETARKIKESQDSYCAKAKAGFWKDLNEFPYDLQWEALVDVLRGRVKVHTHCYEAVDFSGLVGLTNEFKFPIAAFHHAHEAYLVPDVLKSAYGHPPAIAMFATNSRYKRESYRGSEFAPKILAKEGLPVVMKSDHPVLNSRHLIFEAQQAHYFGLPEDLALASVTSTPAVAIGMDHRIGYLKKGYDADVVVWDSHPLAIGATPRQVFVDGIPQISVPYTVYKSSSLQKAPRTPDFDQEAKDALKYDGLPPLGPEKSISGVVVFTNVSSLFLKSGGGVEQVFLGSGSGGNLASVIVENGAILCYGVGCSSYPSTTQAAEHFNLQGGSLSPGLVSFGSPLGLEEIRGEATTSDGSVKGLLEHDFPPLIAKSGVIKAKDGLMFSTRDALLSYRAGVTAAIVAPKTSGFLSGLGTYFSTGASHALQHSAVLQDTTGVHVGLSHSSPSSVTSQIAALRHLLLHSQDGAGLFSFITKGAAPLVLTVNSADIMASLINLKKEVEEESGNTIKMVFAGAQEAHLLAPEIGAAGVGVILSSSRPYPDDWDSRRIMPGPPLTEEGSVTLLKKHGVTVAIGVPHAWMARNTRFYTAWAGLEANGQLSSAETIALSSTDLERLLGVHPENGSRNMVATMYGSLLDFESKVVAVTSPGQGVTHFL